ncbi:Imm53 family immunity protein [Micromonospora sp. NPDC047620]|uniref:Imm53 family immunity protein n=1 Tax=Micromonospora sp. NPDC047620 TaxID=3364251 RepID=UPI0037196A0C
MSVDLTYLESWFVRQCDGDWEHEYGIRIETTDNPGWTIEVDLLGSDLEGRLLSRRKLEPAVDRWVWVWSDGQRFNAACDASSLNVALQQFRVFAEGRAPATFGGDSG